MQLLTKAIRQKLITQARSTATDKRPVVKFFTPDGSATWLISELMDDGDSLFGLCDLGMGEPELGYVSLNELLSVRGKMGLPVERDLWFTPTMTLVEYAERARREGGIHA